MKVLFLFFLLGSCLSIYSQDCPTNYQNENKFKEIYDYLSTHTYPFTINSQQVDHTALTYPSNVSNLPADANDAVIQFGNLETASYLLESQIRMYEITHDKAYLIKAINQSIHLMSVRGGPTAPDAFAWASGFSNTAVSGDNDTYIPYIPGTILRPMAHLCHLILYDEYSTLCNANLPISPNNLMPNLPSLPSNTYGQFADWLVHRCVESLDWCIDNFWLNDQEGFREESTDGWGASINQQAHYATAFFYLGHLTNINPCFAYQGYYSGLQSYMDKASILANLFTSPVKVYNDGNNCVNNNNCTDLDVFRLISSEDSYWWYTTGWGFQKEEINNHPSWDCNNEWRVACSYYEDITPDQNLDNYRSIEDISHAASTLIYPALLYKYNVTSNNTPYFTLTDMIRFRNVITNVSWNGDNNLPKFYSTVSGQGYDGHASSSSCPTLPCPLDRYRWDVLQWMSFAEYEYPNSDLYNLLLTKYKTILNPLIPGYSSIGDFLNADKMKALSEFVDQTWKRNPCYDLTIYNRKLTYNQNFYAGHDLEINPTANNCYHELNDQSFADPMITTNEFVVESNVTSSIEAGNSVTLKGEVHFKFGSEVTLKNTTGNCFTGGRLSAQLPQDTAVGVLMISQMNNAKLIRENENNSLTSSTPALKILPNPASEYFEVSCSNSITNIAIYNLLQELVLEYNQLNTNEYRIGTAQLLNGIYLVVVDYEHGQESSKLIISNK